MVHVRRIFKKPVPKHIRRCLLGCGLLFWGLVGCDGGSSALGVDVAAEPIDAGDASNQGGPDVGPIDGVGSWDGTDGDAEFVVGTNVTGKAKPGEFTPLQDQGDLFVELGFQGSYMVVLALQTRGYVTAKVKITTKLVVGGQEKASLTIKNKKLVPGGNGYDYWYNIFVVTEDYLDYQNRLATVTLALHDAESDMLLVQDSVDVFIRPPN